MYNIIPIQVQADMQKVITMHMQMVSPNRGREKTAATSRATVVFLVHHHNVMVHKEVRYGARPGHRSLARPKIIQKEATSYTRPRSG